MSDQVISAYLSSIVGGYKGSSMLVDPKFPTYKYVAISEKDVEALLHAIEIVEKRTNGHSSNA